jgi:hypothetical protein
MRVTNILLTISMISGILTVIGSAIQILYNNLLIAVIPGIICLSCAFIALMRIEIKEDKNVK